MKQRSPVVVFLSMFMVAIPLMGHVFANESLPRLPDASGMALPKVQPLSFHTEATCSIGGFDFQGPQALPVAPPDAGCPAIVTPEDTACYAVDGRSIRAAGCLPLCNKPIAPAGRIAGFDFQGYTQRIANANPQYCPNYPTFELIGCYLAGGVPTRDAECLDICSLPIAFPGGVTGYSFTAYVQTLAPYPGQICTSNATPELVACSASGGVAKKTFECEDLCSTPIAPVCPEIAASRPSRK